MKKMQWSSLLLVAVVGCSSMSKFSRNPSSLQSPEYIISQGADGHPTVTMQAGDPNYVDPSLKDDVISEDALIRMQNELRQLSSITLEDIEPAKIALPDYDVASKTMRALMKASVVNYFTSLDAIKKEVIRTLSELLALKRLADQERDLQGLLHKEYELDVKKKLPGLNEKINKIYGNALENLYSLNSHAIVPATTLSKYGNVKNPFKESVSVNLAEGLYGICTTSLCIKRLQSDLEEWHIFVRKFNNHVSFSEYGSGKSTWTKDGANTSPIITIALIDAAQDILRMGLKKNKDYSVAGVIAKAGADVIKTPAGVAMFVLSAPVYVFEKTGRVIANVLSFQVMKVELALKEKESYKQEVVFKGFRQSVLNYSKGLSSAIYVTEGDEKSGVISSTFKTCLAKAMLLVPDVMNYFSSKELVNLDSDKTMTFRESISFLSPEKLEEIKPHLTADQKLYVKVLSYEHAPAKLFSQKLDEIIMVLTKTNNPAAFTPGLESNPDIKKRIFELAPDLKTRYSNTRPANQGNSTGSGEVATGPVKQLLITDIWYFGDRPHYSIDFNMENGAFIATARWNGVIEKKKVKILDRDVYLDWNNDGQFSMKFITDGSTTMTYEYLGQRSPTKMILQDTRNTKDFKAELVKGVWLFGDRIGYQVTFRKDSSGRITAHRNWNGEVADSPVEITTDSVQIDWNRNNNFDMRFLKTNDPSKLGYTYLGQSSPTQMIRKIEEN